MSFLQKILLFFILIIGANLSAFAANVDRLEETISEYNVNIPERIYVEDTLEVDITNLWETLSQSFWEFELEYEWEIFSQPPQTWPTLEVSFDSFWVKAIQLQIFTTTQSRIWDDGVEIPAERKLIYRSSKNIFVYQKSIPVILSSDLDQVEKDNFITSAQDQWVLIYSLGDFSEASISGDEILANLSTYKLSFSEKSDYIALWWDKEFIFSVSSETCKTCLTALIKAWNKSIS